MESLFNTSISGVDYHVIFDQEKYIFSSKERRNDFQEFSLVREHDEWHSPDPLPEDIKQQATDALDQYLLKQH